MAYFYPPPTEKPLDYTLIIEANLFYNLVYTHGAFLLK